jgi:HD superfamily phosphohydrolase YqeK
MKMLTQYGELNAQLFTAVAWHTDFCCTKELPINERAVYIHRVCTVRREGCHLETTMRDTETTGRRDFTYESKIEIFGIIHDYCKYLHWRVFLL